MTKMEDQLNEIGQPRAIFLSMKAEDTPQNAAIHDAFREAASIECKNDYTLMLGKLLEYYEADAKVQMLYNEIGDLRNEVKDLRGMIEVNKEDKKDDGAF